MNIHHICQGTCSRSIDIEVEEGIIKEVRFDGGCHGNTQGVGALRERDARDRGDIPP